MQHDTQLRVKAVELATRTTQNPDALIKTAKDIYKFIKREEETPTFVIYDLGLMIDDIINVKKYKPDFVEFDIFEIFSKYAK